MERPQLVEQLPAQRFTHLTPTTMEPFRMDGTLQMLDDCGSSLSFAHANVYTDKRITMGKERVIRHVVLPYHVLRSSRSYSWYQLIQAEGAPTSAPFPLAQAEREV